LDALKLTEDISQWSGWMKRLLQRAALLGAQGEVPVSAVILDEAGRCIGHGRNTRERDRDPMGHAELVALRQASKLRGDWRFNGCTLIVTLEPCTMCAAALVQARMGRVVFAARDPKRGGLGGTIDLSDHPSAHHRMTVVAGVLEEEARVQLETWFRQRRRRNR
jgi:tRNA(adenine34) deaminase